MADIKPKFFMTSDYKFVINIDKIAFIDSNIYGDDFVYDESSDDKKPYLVKASGIQNIINSNVNTSINTYLTYSYESSHDYIIYSTPNKVNASYFYVYIEGSQSPLKLIYGDGIQLINFIASNSGGGIFHNIYSSSLVETYSYFEKSKDTKYKCSYSYVPNLVNKMFITDLNDIKFNGDNKNPYMPYSLQLFLTDRTV